MPARVERMDWSCIFKGFLGLGLRLKSEKLLCVAEGAVAVVVDDRGIQRIGKSFIDFGVPCCDLFV